VARGLGVSPAGARASCPLELGRLARAPENLGLASSCFFETGARPRQVGAGCPRSFRFRRQLWLSSRGPGTSRFTKKPHKRCILGRFFGFDWPFLHSKTSLF